MISTVSTGAGSAGVAASSAGVAGTVGIAGAAGVVSPPSPQAATIPRQRTYASKIASIFFISLPPFCFIYYNKRTGAHKVHLF